MSKYSTFFVPDRITPSSVKGRGLLEESYSDRSRIVFSSAFRRLQQKAQVFSLEKNTFVRSRMTHSIEVSDYGKGMATKIALKLIEKGELEQEELLLFINIVENSCYLHDIGNPPFGHFGESAIQNWFDKNWEIIFEKSIGSGSPSKKILKEYINDFKEFDGNPQGFRIITKLQRVSGGKATGLNLTLSQLYCFLKYVRIANGDKKGTGITKKAGYFNSEKEVVKEIFDKIPHEQKRYPLTYIMEAADDIAYCLSDIEDGIEKKILTFNEFDIALQNAWKDNTGDETFPYTLSTFFLFKTTLARDLIKEAVDIYLKDHEDFLIGKRGEIFTEESSYNAFYVLKSLKKVSKLLLFRSSEAEGKELAGYHIISRLLDKFRQLLELSKEDFERLLLGRENPDECKEMPIEWRLFNTLPKRYIEVYETELKKEIEDKGYNNDEVRQLEWFYRSHLIVDFISGMTDNYSLEVYKHFYGIEIR